MKRTLFFAAALAASAVSADALLWYVDLSESGYGSSIGTFDSISLKANDESLAGGTYLYSSGFSGTPAQSGDYIAATDAGVTPQATGYYYTTLADSFADGYASYSFTLELMRGGEKVGWLEEAISGDELRRYVYATSADDFNPGAPNAYDFGPKVVPEPTSGVMLLAGGALLALRRRTAARSRGRG